MIARSFELVFGFELRNARVLAERLGLRVTEVTGMFLTVEGAPADIETFGAQLEQLLRVSR